MVNSKYKTLIEMLMSALWKKELELNWKVHSNRQQGLDTARGTEFLTLEVDVDKGV